MRDAKDQRAAGAASATFPCKACHAPEDRADGLCAKCQRDRGNGELTKKRKVGSLLSDKYVTLKALAAHPCCHPPTCGHVKFSECRNALVAAITDAAQPPSKEAP